MSTVSAPFQVIGKSGRPILSVFEDESGTYFCMAHPTGGAVWFSVSETGATARFEVGQHGVNRGGSVYIQAGGGRMRTCLQLGRQDSQLNLEVTREESLLELATVTREGDRLSEAKLAAAQDGAGLELQHPPEPAEGITDDERDDLNREATLTVWASDGIARTELPAAG
jgi:hypothetical protein